MDICLFLGFCFVVLVFLQMGQKSPTHRGKNLPLVFLSFLHNLELDRIFFLFDTLVVLYYKRKSEKIRLDPAEEASGKEELLHGKKETFTTMYLLYDFNF